MLPATLLPSLLLALAVAANPVVVQRSLVTLPMSRRFNFTNFNLLQHDQSRANALKAKGEARATGVSQLASDIAAVIRADSEPLDNHAVSYIASVGVGSPPTFCK